MSEQHLPLAGPSSSAAFSDRVRAWIAARAGASLTKNGYALVVSSLIASALGMLFWAIAARSFTKAEIGIGAALIAAMTPLASAAQFNFKNVLYRFVASPGPRTRHLVLRLYLVSTAAAVVLGSGFAALVAWIDPDLTALFHSPWVTAAFVAALVIWTIYGLQEAALVALRLSTLMPAKTLSYAVAKVLALLALGAFAATGLSILAAWVVPALAIGVATSAMLMRYAAGAKDAADVPAFSSREFAGFLGWDYVGSLASSLSYGLAPVLVIATAGTVAGAHFYLAFSIAYVLYLVGSQMGAAMMAEHSSHRRHPRALYADALVQTLLPVTAVALGVIVLAPQIMQVFGADFVDPSSTVLRLLVLSAIPGSAIAIFLAVCRARGRVRLVALVQLFTLCVGLGLGYILSSVLAETGMALALLLTQASVAGGLAVWTLGAPGVLHGVAVDLGSALVRVWKKLLALRDKFRSEAMTSTLALDGHQWIVASVHASLSDARTLLLRRAGAEAVHKSARSDEGIRAILREHAELAVIGQDVRLQSFRNTLPKVIALSRGEDETSLLLDRLPGQSGQRLAADRMDLALRAAVDHIGAIHAATAVPSGADAQWLAKWVDGPAETLAAALPGGSGRTGLDAIKQHLASFFTGRTLLLGRGHGDYCLDNILFDPAAGAPTPMVSGIVDWSESRSDAPAGLDATFLAVATRSSLQERELGHIVLELLSRPMWSEREQTWLGDATADEAELQALILLAWLNHAASNLRKSDRYGASRFWLWANVELVLESYERTIHQSA